MSTILITGGSGKIGFQLVKYFLSKNFTVVTTTRNKENFFAKAKEQISAQQIDQLKIIEVDFNAKDAVTTIIGSLKENKLHPQHIVHNARSTDFLKIESDNSVTRENFMGEFFIDVVIPYEITLGILQHTPALKNVIFISSMYGVVAPTPSLYENFPQASAIHYGVAKAAQIHLTKELAVRLAPGVRVNCVSFGGIKGRVSETFLKKYESLTPANKMLEEEDVTGPVDFLVSDGSSQMTGQNVIVDGGWSIW